MAQMNEADPFHIPDVRASASGPPFALVHPAVVLALILTAWLHLVAHLPYRFCDVVLTVIGLIMGEVGRGALAPSMRFSLTGCLSALGLEPRFRMYPTCPVCLEPHPDSIMLKSDARCEQCRGPLFKDDNTQSGRRGLGSNGKARKPLLRTPARSIIDQLADLVM